MVHMTHGEAYVHKMHETVLVLSLKAAHFRLNGIIHQSIILTSTLAYAVLKLLVGRLLFRGFKPGMQPWKASTLPTELTGELTYHLILPLVYTCVHAFVGILHISPSNWKGMCHWPSAEHIPTML